VKADGTVV
jgi:hypothetical protein